VLSGIFLSVDRSLDAELHPLCSRMSDSEQRAQRKKRARRDFDDEDYEEPAQPRRVSARRQVGSLL